MAWAEKQASGKWRGRYRTKTGERRWADETFTRKSDAVRDAGELETKSRKPGWRDPKKGSITWGEWLDDWTKLRVIEPKTKQTEQSMIQKWLAPAWQDRPLDEITRRDVQQWVNDMRQTNTKVGPDGLLDEDEPKYPSTASVRRYLNVFVSSMTAAVDAELIGANPALGMKLPPITKKDPVFLSHEEAHDIMEQLDGQDLAVVELLLSTGIRWGELAGLHTHRLDLAGSALQVQEVWDGEEIKPYPKSTHPRRVPLVQWGVEHLEVPKGGDCGIPHREGKCSTPLVFTSRDGTPLNGRNFARRVLDPAVKRAHLEHRGITPHTFRHTYASWLVAEGVPLLRVSELLGHASVKTTEIYAHLVPAKTSDVKGALPVPRGTNVGQTPTLAPVTVLRPA